MSKIDFITNLISGALGSFIGVLGALCIQLFVFKHEKSKESKNFKKYIKLLENVYLQLKKGFYRSDLIENYYNEAHITGRVMVLEKFIIRLREVPMEYIPDKKIETFILLIEEVEISKIYYSNLLKENYHKESLIKHIRENYDTIFDLYEKLIK
ncbi:hypothetical protein [Bacillus sp. FJAT-49736]|uniref:hypothetical protein n=1 Tax=Bacillus sp. FJAT-49736 TaxID=2833582 RepID=UPI001BC92AA7|nr:hypothetical protein [Bacillus sp. FJAT-49736]MBS4172105.1 hypothetical protein [Bacillus sp. FJAT-49736]